MDRGCTDDQQAPGLRAGMITAAAREDDMSRGSRLKQAGPWKGTVSSTSSSRTMSTF